MTNNTLVITNTWTYICQFFSNFVLVINLFFIFILVDRFLGVWGHFIFGHFITLVFLLCKKEIKFKNLVPFDQDFFFLLNGVIKNMKTVKKVDKIPFLKILKRTIFLVFLEKAELKDEVGVPFFERQCRTRPILGLRLKLTVLLLC